MGDIADMIIDDMIEQAIGMGDYYYHSEPNYNIWADKSGRRYEIVNMTDSHLINCIKFLRCGDYKYKNGYIKSMEAELNNNRRNKNMTIQNVDLKVVGVTFMNEDGTSRKEGILEMAKMVGNNEHVTIELVREPSNRFDINAVKVIADGGFQVPRQIGYIGKEYASIIAPMMDMGTPFCAVVKDVGEFKNRPYCEITINQLA